MTSALLLLLLLAPLLVAVVCLAGSRRLPARVLAFSGAGGMLLALLVLLVLGQRGGGITPGLLWGSLGSTPIMLQIRVDALNLLPLAVVYGGAALVLALLGLAFAPSTRGFGGLISALVLATFGSSFALTCATPLLLPLGWGIALLSGYAATRAAGVDEAEGQLPAGIVAGLFALLFLQLALLLGERPATIGGQPLGLVLSLPVLLFLLLATMIAFGLPPFHVSLVSAANAPAGLATVTVGLGLPLLAGYALLRLGVLAPALPEPWPLVFVSVGLVGLVAAGAGSLGAESMRQMLGWQISSQGGLLLLSLGAGGSQGLAAALMLLLNTSLLALSGYLALALLERRTGRDRLGELPRLRTALPLAGLAFGVAAMAALSLPPTPGFWGRLWLASALQERFVWAFPLLLVGGALAVPAWLAPLAAFWRVDTTLPATEQVRRDQLLALPAALALLVFGVAPWLGWLPAALRELAGQSVVAPEVNMRVAAFMLLLALAVVVGALRLRGLAVVMRLEEERPALPLAQALADSLSWLRLIAEPGWLYNGLWWLLGLLGGIQRVVAIFEQRYYLAGVLLALISILLLMVQ